LESLKGSQREIVVFKFRSDFIEPAHARVVNCSRPGDQAQAHDASLGPPYCPPRIPSPRSLASFDAG
jgi:hypothetical protein